MLSDDFYYTSDGEIPIKLFGVADTICGRGARFGGCGNRFRVGVIRNAMMGLQTSERRAHEDFWTAETCLRFSCTVESSAIPAGLGAPFPTTVKPKQRHAVAVHV
jgi:hypothetical protein